MSQWIQAVLNAGTFKAWAKQLWKDAPMRSRQVLLVAGVLVLLSFCTGTAFGATVTEGPWTLYRGTSIVQPRVDYPSLAACAAAADRLTPRTYTCRTIATVVVEASPVPVNCAVSAWSGWSGGAWGACSNGSQSRTETRSRTITTQPANGGQACPVLTETRTATQDCTSPDPTPGVTGSYEVGPTSITLTGTFVQYPSSATTFGSITGGSYNNAPRTINGSRNGTYNLTGFTIQLPAGTTRIYVGGYNSAGRITAGGYTHSTANVSGQWLAIYTISTPEPLSVRWEKVAGPSGGNVTIQAIARDTPATGSAALSWAVPVLYVDGTPIAPGQLSGFNVYRGQTAESLTRVAEVDANATGFDVQALPSGTHYFAVTAVAGGVESAFSPVGSKTVP